MIIKCLTVLNKCLYLVIIFLNIHRFKKKICIPLKKQLRIWKIVFNSVTTLDLRI
jgi:hypothetical protein